MNIYGKLQKCRVELQKKALKKSGENTFAKFKYYELADFLPTVNEIFESSGLSSNFSINSENMAILIIVTSDTMDADKIERIQFTSPIAEASVKGCTPIQSLGAIHTYMKRYLYLNALEIVENDALEPNAGAENTGDINTTTPANVADDKNSESTDFISEVKKLNTMPEIIAFHNAHINDVADKGAFIKAINSRRTEIGGKKNASN